MVPMARLIAVIGLVAVSPVQAQADKIESGIKADCAEEWPGDYAMQVYCINRQIGGYNAMAKVRNAGMNGDEKRMLVKCLDEWTTKGGQDWAMVEYCYRRQHQAYTRLKGN